MRWLIAPARVSPQSTLPRGAEHHDAFQAEGACACAVTPPALGAGAPHFVALNNSRNSARSSSCPFCASKMASIAPSAPASAKGLSLRISA